MVIAALCIGTFLSLLGIIQLRFSNYSCHAFGLTLRIVVTAGTTVVWTGLAMYIRKYQSFWIFKFSWDIRLGSIDGKMLNKVLLSTTV